MKKILVFMLSLIMVFAFAGCGGGDAENGEAAEPEKEVKLYGGYFSMDVPEGYEVGAYEDTFTKPVEEGSPTEYMLKVDIEMSSAEDAAKSRLETDKKMTAAEDVTIGDHTWKVMTFTWNEDRESVKLYTDLDEGHSVSVTGFCMDLENEDLNTMVGSMVFEEGAYEKNLEFEQSL